MRSCCDVKNNSSSDAPLTIALVGNPNVGKSVFFTRLTGIGVEVSNYPGTTVDITKGTLKHEGESINVVDLPGIYSLSTSTEDERATMRYLIHECPAVIINIIDATRLARNLNLTLQLLEIDIPMVVALNQVDAAEKMGIKIDVEALEEELGVSINEFFCTTFHVIHCNCQIHHAFFDQFLFTPISFKDSSMLKISSMFPAKSITAKSPDNGNVSQLKGNTEFNFLPS